MSGKMCVGAATNNAFLPHQSKAFCEGMQYRSEDTASNRPVTGNPHDGDGSEAETAWDLGWAVSNDASVVFNLTGSIDNVNFVLTGSINPTASANVTGVGTLFDSELVVGDNILVSGETREVATITNDTTLTVTSPFTDVADDTSPEIVGTRVVVGVGTLFTTELVVGDSITVTSETRIVAAITDNTNLTVTLLFTETANDTSPDRVRAAALTDTEVGCCGLRGLTIAA